MLQRPAVGAVLGVALCALVCGSAQGQGAFPSKNITMVVPLPAGGTADLLCRYAAEKATRVARPAGGGREPARRRRRPGRHGAGAACAAGRLHAAVLDAAQLQHHASGVHESVVRSAAARADQRARDLSADHHHAEGFPGEQSQGIHRLRQGQSRQGHLRPPGQGQHRASARRADDAQGQLQDDGSALSRQRAGDQRSARRHHRHGPGLSAGQQGQHRRRQAQADRGRRASSG